MKGMIIMKKVYFRNVVQTDTGVIIVRGYYYEAAPYIYKQMIFSY